jgi:hypothetical protein
MRYIVLIGHDEKSHLTKEQSADLFAAYQKYQAELTKAGVLLGGSPLQPTADGCRISGEAGKRKVVDGPFSESKEIVGGYFLIEAKSKQEAVEWAARCPAAQLGDWSYVEVRELMEIPS